MALILTWAAIVAFAISATLWFASTIVKVDAEKNAEKIRAELGYTPAQIRGSDGSDFYATIQLQSKWSRAACIATGLALALQAVATALSST